jgi:hypothetical protein
MMVSTSAIIGQLSQLPFAFLVIYATHLALKVQFDQLQKNFNLTQDFRWLIF